MRTRYKERTRFKELRAKLVLSQPDFARRADVSLATVCGFESGRVEDFSPRIKQKLAIAYGVTIKEVNAACKAKEQPAHAA